MVADASLCLCWAVMRVRWRFWRTNYLTLSPSCWLATATDVQMCSHFGRRMSAKSGSWCVQVRLLSSHGRLKTRPGTACS